MKDKFDMAFKLMIIYLLRAFVAEFHAFVMNKCAEDASYSVDFGESWEDSKNYFNKVWKEEE